MFGHVAKKQAVTADLGPISKELIKIENGIEEIKNSNDIDLTPVNNKIDNNYKLIQQLWNAVIGDANNMFNTLWGLYNKLDDNYMHLQMVLGMNAYETDLDYVMNNSLYVFPDIYNRLKRLEEKSLNNNNLIEILSDTNYVYMNSTLLSERKFLYIDYFVYPRYVIAKIINPYRLIPISDKVSQFEFITTDYDNCHKLYNSMFKMDCSYVINDGDDRTEGFTIDLMTQSCTTGKLQTLMIKTNVGQAEIIYSKVATDTDFDWNCYILPQSFILPFKK